MIPNFSKNLQSLFCCLLIISLILLTGCVASEGEAHFKDGRLQFDRCSTFPILPWEPDFHSAEVFGNHVVIQLKNDGGVKFLTNILTLRITDKHLISKSIDQELELGSELITGNLILFETCPDSQASPQLTGKIVFSEFNPSKGGWIEGKMNFSVVDGKKLSRECPHSDECTDGEFCYSEECSGGEFCSSQNRCVLGENISGHFSFEAQTGPPYRRFTAPSYGRE